MTARDELDICLRASKGVLPVMFVGSGFSRRYLGSPDWFGLLERYANIVGQPLSYFRASAGGDAPQMASLIAEALFELWYRDPAFAMSRTEFEDKVDSKSDPLKYEISQYLLALPADKLTDELEKFKQVRAQAIITTNWDTLIEACLPEYERYIGQTDVLFSAVQSVGEIYKIHGCATKPHSLVLTREDYEVYWDRNPYLIAKILTLFVEHPMIFVGYSLSDPHIIKLLENLASCLTDIQLAQLNDRMIFVRRRQSGEPADFRHSSLTIGKHTIPIREYLTSDFGEVYDVLSQLRRGFSPKLLRALKESVYSLAYDTKPKGMLRVLPFEPDSDPADVELVLGVGTMARLSEKGYAKYSRSEIAYDMLTGVSDHNGRSLVDKLLPELYRNSWFNPIYYPLHVAGDLDATRNPKDPNSLPRHAQEILIGGSKDISLWHSATVGSEPFAVAISRSSEAIWQASATTFSTPEDVLALRAKLLEIVDPESSTLGTFVAKVCCKYDRVAFGPEYSGDRAELEKALSEAYERDKLSAAS